MLNEDSECECQTGLYFNEKDAICKQCGPGLIIDDGECVELECDQGEYMVTIEN